MTSSPNGSPTKELPRSGVNNSFASGPVQRPLETSAPCALRTAPISTSCRRRTPSRRYHRGLVHVSPEASGRALATSVAHRSRRPVEDVHPIARQPPRG